jgi:hypothetical protein
LLLLLLLLLFFPSSCCSHVSVLGFCVGAPGTRGGRLLP